MQKLCFMSLPSSSSSVLHRSQPQMLQEAAPRFSKQGFLASRSPPPSRRACRLQPPRAFPPDLEDIQEGVMKVLRAKDRLPQVLKTALARAPWADSKTHAVKQAVTDLYCNLDRQAAEAVLAPDFVVHKAGHERTFSRSEYISLIHDTILPSIPDFQWCPASNYETDGDGYVLVTVQACGHHTGKAFSLLGLPSIPASGRHFSLEEEAQMVRVLDGKVQEIKVFPVRGSGPKALYVALGGEVPEPQLVTALDMEQLPLP